MTRAKASASRSFVLVAIAVASAAIPFVSRPLHAEPDNKATALDAESARRARVVLTVSARKVTVGELEDHVAAIPIYQLAQFGGSREAVARAYLEQVMVRD